MAPAVAHVKFGKIELRRLHRHENRDGVRSRSCCGYSYSYCASPVPDSCRGIWHSRCISWKSCRSDLEPLHNHVSNRCRLHCAGGSFVYHLSNLGARDRILPCLFDLLFRCALSAAGRVLASTAGSSSAVPAPAATVTRADWVGHF